MFKYPRSVDFTVYAEKEKIYFQGGIQCANFVVFKNGVSFNIIDNDDNHTLVRFLITILDIVSREKGFLIDNESWQVVAGEYTFKLSWQESSSSANYTWFNRLLCINELTHLALTLYKD